MGDRVQIPRGYTDPATLEEAERRRDELSTIITTIQAQLADRNRVGPEGRRMDDKEFHTWRRGAVYAMTSRLAELRLVKAWIRNHHAMAPRPTGPADATPVEEAVADARRAVYRLADLCRYQGAEIRRLEQENEVLRASPQDGNGQPISHEGGRS